MNCFCSVLALFLLCCGTVLNAQPAERLCSEVRVDDGVPALFINGKAYPPYAYMSYLGEEKFYRETAQAGLHLYNIPAYLGDRGINSSSGIGPFRPAIWVGKGKYDLSSIEKDFDELLKADPKAKVIIRIHLDPPVWWERENPEEVCLQPDGRSIRTSFASMKWRRDAGKALKYITKQLLKSPYASHLVGIHVAGGFTEEWYYHFKDYFFDESKARKNEFRKWLRLRYGNDQAALRNGWRNNSVTFRTAGPADISGKERIEEWRNATAHKRYFDTFDFHAGLMADHIAYFCEIVKKASNGCLLTGAFYGYHYFVSDARRGHGALEKILDCPYLDYLSSPNDYKRVAGEDWAPFAAIKSVQLHGKLWLAENDTRTSISTLLKDRAPEINPPGDWYSSGVWIGPQDMRTSVSFLWKNLARMLAYGYGGWWFDMWGGWFSDPELLFVIQKAQDFYKDYPPVQYDEMQPEVAVIVDERLQFWDKSYGTLTDRITGNRYALGKTGAPYDLYLRTDLDKIPAGKYKALWFMGIMDMTEVEKAMAEKFLESGALVMHTDRKGTSVSPGKSGVPETLDGKLEWTAEGLAGLWDRAGVHRYGESGDVIYAGHGWLSIHSVKGGEKTLKLPFYARIVDPVTSQLIATSSDTVKLVLPPGGTRILRIEPQ